MRCGRPWLNTGDPQIGVAGSGRRGFQANSRVITTSDEML